MVGMDGLVGQAIQLAQVSGMSFSEALTGLRAATDLSEASVERARAVSAEGQLKAANERLVRVRRALDDELANLADDGARLSHSVVRRIEAALADPEGGN